MTAITTAPADGALTRPRPAARPRDLATWAALAGRRVMLSAHTPREVLAPLVTPLLFALVIAPALAKMIPQAGPGGADYSTFVIVGTVGLLIPLTCTFAGIGVIVDRASGARRELLAAPISRSLIVLGNMAVAIAVSLLQVAVLIVAGGCAAAISTPQRAGPAGSSARSSCSPCSCTRWPRSWPTGFPPRRNTSGSPPWWRSCPGSCGFAFPITALPGWLASVARILPTTHTLALLRFGVLGRGGAGLHDIWGMSNTTADAALSLLVLAGWAVLTTAAAVRVFKRSAVN